MNHPPAPWKMQGEGWMGLFKADQAVPLPEKMLPLLPSKWIMLALLRYRSGTLQYSEFIMGRWVINRGVPGLTVDYIWVDDEQSQAGGRNLWGLPKEMAQFTWEQNRVTIHDSQGLIAKLELPTPGAIFIPTFAPFPAVGVLSDPPKMLLARLWGRLKPASVSISAWSDRFPYKLSRMVSVNLPNFSATFPPPFRK